MVFSRWTSTFLLFLMLAPNVVFAEGGADDRTGPEFAFDYLGATQEKTRQATADQSGCVNQMSFGIYARYPYTETSGNDGTNRGSGQKSREASGAANAGGAGSGAVSRTAGSHTGRNCGTAGGKTTRYESPNDGTTCGHRRFEPSPYQEKMASKCRSAPNNEYEPTTRNER